MRILGIDPGLATIGIGILEADSPEHVTPLDWLTITTQAGLSLPERLAEIAQDLRVLLQEYEPELAVVEKIFFAVNEKTAIDVAQARGALLAVLAEQGIRIVEATPMQLKLAITGDGRADKQQIQKMLMQCLHLEEPPTPDDAADALALAFYGVVDMKMPIV